MTAWATLHPYTREDMTAELLARYPGWRPERPINFQSADEPWFIGPNGIDRAKWSAVGLANAGPDIQGASGGPVVIDRGTVPMWIWVILAVGAVWAAKEGGWI